MIAPASPRKITVGAGLAALLALQAAQALADNPPNRPAEADNVHVVLLVAGADSNIGNADVQDVRAVKHAVETAFAGEAKRLHIHDLTHKNPKTGKFWTGPEIVQYLRNLKDGPNDNVLVFHSGHGGIKDRKHPEDSHILTVDGGPIARKDIVKAVQAHQPRALILLTDCCSSYMDAPVSLDNEEVNVKTVRNLLLRPAGLVSITAAQDGKEATATFKGTNPGHAGSAFTVAMTRLWYRHDVTFSTWKAFYPKLREETKQASGGQHQARAFRLIENAPQTAALAPAEALVSESTLD
jgi:hypothetical protein